MSDRRDPEAGFTLLELLVAMALLGLLTMVMFGSMRFGVQAWARTQHAVTTANGLSLVENTLRLDLSRAYPLLTTTGSTAQMAFAGSSRQLGYLAPSIELSGALDRVVVAVEQNGNDLELVRRSRFELSSATTTKRNVLLGHLRRLEFEYFGTTAGDEMPKWFAEWRNQSRLPQLIRISLETVDGAQRTFVVAPRLSADVGCAFDALTNSCRGR